MTSTIQTKGRHTKGREGKEKRIGKDMDNYMLIRPKSTLVFAWNEGNPIFLQCRLKLKLVPKPHNPSVGCGRKSILETAHLTG